MQHFDQKWWYPYFQGSQYSVASDLWSLGLSLVEISFGMYPIPPPDQHTLVQMFGPQILEDPGLSLTSPHPRYALRSTTMPKLFISLWEPQCQNYL